MRIAAAGVDEGGLAFWSADDDGVGLADVEEGDLDEGVVLGCLLCSGGGREGEEEQRGEQGHGAGGEGGWSDQVMGANVGERGWGGKMNCGAPPSTQAPNASRPTCRPAARPARDRSSSGAASSDARLRRLVDPEQVDRSGKPFHIPESGNMIGGPYEAS